MLATCSNVTTQTAVSERTTTSATVMMTVKTGLMNQLTAVSDISVYLAVVSHLGTIARQQLLAGVGE